MGLFKKKNGSPTGLGKIAAKAHNTTSKVAGTLMGAIVGQEMADKGNALRDKIFSGLTGIKTEHSKVNPELLQLAAGAMPEQGETNQQWTDRLKAAGGAALASLNTNLPNDNILARLGILPPEQAGYAWQKYFKPVLIGLVFLVGGFLLIKKYK